LDDRVLRCKLHCTSLNTSRFALNTAGVDGVNVSLSVIYLKVSCSREAFPDFRIFHLAAHVPDKAKTGTWR
jgi:hypothetical protein